MPVFSWTVTVRRIVFDPLMNGDPPLTLKDIAQRLLKAAPPDAQDDKPDAQVDKPDAARAKRTDPLRSGRGEPSVQRMAKGEMVPTRDVLFDLLRILEEERGAPQRHDLEELWAAYKPALQERLPFVYKVYEVVDGYSSALLLVGFQQQEIARLATSLEQHRHRAARANERVQRARRAQAVHRRALRAAGQELDRLRVREQRVRHELDDASSEAARLRQDVATARAQVEQWQEQAEWHLREEEELRQESATQREAWQEREALLLERLAQACETLQTVAEQAAVVEAAMQARETHWRDQAQAGHAAARSARADADAARSQAAVARAEAEAAREEATRVLQAQQDRADALVAAAGVEQDQAQQAIDRLKEELRQAQAQLRAAQQNAVQQDAQLTSFVAERALNSDLDDIVSQVLAQHQELGPGEPAWIDARPEATHIRSSEDQPPGLTSGGHAAMAAIPTQPKPDVDLPDSPAEPPGSADPNAPVEQSTAQPGVAPYQAMRLPAADTGGTPNFPPGPAVGLDAPQGVRPAGAQGEPTGPDTSAPSSALVSSGTAGPGATPDTPRLPVTASQVSPAGVLKTLLGCFGLFGAWVVSVTLVILLALWVTPASAPVAYASGSKPTTNTSGSSAFGGSSTTYTWTVGGTHPVRARFRLTNQEGTLPGHLTAQPAKGCRPKVQWTLTTDGRTIADGTLTDTDSHKIKGVVPDNAKALYITATYSQGRTCTTTLSWIIST
ncbi:hypothetical protein ABZ471_20965 [Streptomyces sp. NPDC005728]|uniref:hypothetical protein n=1 Tax=Streptomyces sp. NPDC005728 TaxID=3157054 RepID=UPI0033D0E52F